MDRLELPLYTMTGGIAFYEPRSVAEATALLNQHGDDAKLLAGATALTIMLRQGLIRPAALVNIGHLADEDLRTISCEDSALRIGALVTHRQVEQSEVVRQTIPVLADAFGKVANVRVRNVATVGGVLAESDYASDPPSVFVALGAEVEVAGPSGRRIVPAIEFFVGFFETTLAPDEMVTGVRVPIPAAGTAAVYEKFVTRSSEDRPCLGVAAAVRLEADGATCADLRVAVGAVAEVPQRFPDVEALTRGQPLTTNLAREVAEQYAARISPLDDMRGSAWYRTEMIKVWVRRAIERASAATARPS